MTIPESITSKLVFEKRKNGELDIALDLAQKLVAQSPNDEWNKKALAWCLIDLIKQEAKSDRLSKANNYLRQLSLINLEQDEVLSKSRDYVASLLNPNAKIIEQAKNFSKIGEFEEAVRLYKSLFSSHSLDEILHESYAWDLYKFSKKILDSASSNIDRVKRNINDYLHLTIDKPSLIHSLFLQLATTCNKEGKLKLLSFLPLWNLNFFREEDWDRYIAEDKKEFPSKAEAAIQRATKEASTTNNAKELEYLLPYVDMAMRRHPDNLWLQFGKTKVLIALGRHQEAFSFAIEGAKAKGKEFWAWELLGDICQATDSRLALSCYCKSLLCSSDINFTAKVRIKLAKLLVVSGLYENAKCEVHQVICYREKEGQKIPSEALNISNQPWYSATPLIDKNIELYKRHYKNAEELLFSSLPWSNACAGESYTLPGKDGKKDKQKRSIYVQVGSKILKGNTDEIFYPYGQLGEGVAIQVKCEIDGNDRLKIHVVQNRNALEKWDIFPARVAVIDHVNEEKQLLSFVIDRRTRGTLPLSSLQDAYRAGDLIEIKIHQYDTDKGARLNVLSAHPAREIDSSPMRKVFSSHVKVEKEMGFTSDDIFIHPGLIKKHCIENTGHIDGVAVMSLNEKHNTWGWKAVRIDCVIKAEKDNQ